MTKLLYPEESYAIRGAIFEVNKEMGAGFLEPVYQECMEKEMTLCGIPFERQKSLALSYKGETLEQRFMPDLVCYGEIIVELKAVNEIVDVHRAQLFNYLKATGMRLGFLVNFGHSPKASIERLVL